MEGEAVLWELESWRRQSHCLLRASQIREGPWRSTLALPLVPSSSIYLTSASRWLKLAGNQGRLGNVAMETGKCSA